MKDPVQPPHQSLPLDRTQNDTQTQPPQQTQASTAHQNPNQNDTQNPGQNPRQNPRQNPKDCSWFFWFTLPIYPFGQRRTLRQEVLKQTIWTFEQLQGIFYVVAPIRMTVVRLTTGGLLVYAPVAPTLECLRLVRELEASYGEVKYIILPTASGLEHKVFVGPFARACPRATVFIAPHQWSFPVKLPLSWLGLPPRRTQVLPANSQQTPFAAEFDYATLGPINLGLGEFEEVAFFHRPSRTLLLTDTVVAVSAAPPAIVTLDPYPLLFHARDAASEPLVDTAEQRQRGWQRIVLFAFYFRPAALGVMAWRQAWQAAATAADRSRQAYFGLYPFQWRSNWQQSFMALWGEGRLFVAPILQKLILNRAAQSTLDWSYQVASWNFERIIPCHFEAPLAVTPRQFLEAFAFLQAQSAIDRSTALAENRPLPPEDFAFLQELEQGLDRLGIIEKQSGSP